MAGSLTTAVDRRAPPVLRSQDAERSLVSLRRLALRPRDPHEAHRVATPLELFTDLCYVVGVAQATTQLHHGVTEGRVLHAVVFFGVAFFAIWWAWLGFAWFTSAYDSDDTAHRLLTLLQIFGSLVLAAGIPRIFEGDFALAVAGYVLMRVGLVLSWLRAAAGDPRSRRTAHRYVAGLVVVQTLWIAFLLVPERALLPTFLALAVLELLVPVLAESAGGTPWHPHHIAERYSLMFVIVLGETVLSTTLAIQVAVDEAAIGAHVVLVVVGGVLIVFSTWWLYFSREGGRALERRTNSFLWGFGHYFVFAAGAALGAGLAARVDHYDHRTVVSDLASSAAVTVPTGVLLLALWAVHIRPHDAGVRTWGPLLVVVGGLVVATLVPWTELWAGLLCCGLLVLELRLTRRDRQSSTVDGRAR